MSRRDILFIILIVFIPLGVLAIARYETVHEAEHAVTAQLSDGHGAKFRNIRRTTTGTICGEVNSKNEKGEYQGFRFFYVSDLTEKQTVWVDSDSDGLAYEICNSDKSSP